MDILSDKFNRSINYLRISVTDRCNLRCLYCMPKDGIATFPQQEILTFEEIIRLTKILVSLGVKNVRLTGGEPLVRKDLVNLISQLTVIPGIEEVSLTTNGILLSQYVQELKNTGLSGLNLSLDTLEEEKFRRIAGVDVSFYRVLEGIEKARELALSLKLNVVVMKGINDGEIINFVKFALSQGITLRFIEFMQVSPLWRKDYFLPIEAVKEACGREFVLRKTELKTGGPAEYYQVSDGIIGFIETNQNNCRACNRLRLTSTGELKICLYERGGLSLKCLLREGLNDAQIKDHIRIKMAAKKDTDHHSWGASKVYMSSIGG